MGVSSAWPGDFLRPSSEVGRKFQQRMRSRRWVMTGLLGVLCSGSYASSRCSLMWEGHSLALSSVTHSSGEIFENHIDDRLNASIDAVRQCGQEESLSFSWRTT